MNPEQLAVVVHAVAETLADGWTVTPDDLRPTLVAPPHLDGASLLFVHVPPGRFEISGFYPSSPGIGYFGPYRGAGLPSIRDRITLSDTTPPTKIAAAIRRRLLPVYLPLYLEGTLQMRRALDSIRAAETLANELAQVLGDSVRHLGRNEHRIYVSFPGDDYGHARLDVDGSCVKFDLSLTHTFARELTRFLADHLVKARGLAMADPS